MIKQNAQGTYDLDYSIPKEELVNRVIKHMGLGGKVRENQRGWHPWKEQIRLAVFIPMLDDKKYSNLKGLPENRHECDYGKERAMLFQTLPYRMRFLTTRGKKLERKIWIRINGDKPQRR